MLEFWSLPLFHLPNMWKSEITALESGISYWCGSLPVMHQFNSPKRDAWNVAQYLAIVAPVHQVKILESVAPMTPIPCPFVYLIAPWQFSI